MILTKIIRLLVVKNPQLKLKLKKAGSKLTAFQYIYQSISMTIFSIIGLLVIDFLIFKKNIFNLLIAIFVTFILTPILYKFWFSFVDVQIKKYGREIEGDLLFVSEFFLVSLESGLPLGNAIKNLAKLNRPGGKFFNRIYTEFKTGKDLEKAIYDASIYAPSDMLKNLLKKLRDSLDIGVDLKIILENFIDESSERKIVEIKGFSKKLNPVIMMYLLFGIVLPSLGITFFILAAAALEMTPDLLKYVLIFAFLIMFGFQYIAYSSFKFSKSTI